MQQPLISVIMPCYNGANYVGEALESVRRQTFEAWECIIVNDGSTDSSREVIETFIAKDPRFHLIDIPNGGVSAARNLAIAHSKGRYLFPLDADNKMHPACLEKCIARFLANPALRLVYTEAELFGAETGLWNLPPFDYKTMLKYNMVDNSSLFLRSDFDRVGGYRTNMVHGLEDWDFFIALLYGSAAGQVLKINEPLYYYRVTAASRRMTVAASGRQKEMLDRMVYNNYAIYQEYFPGIYSRVHAYDFQHAMLEKRPVKLLVNTLVALSSLRARLKKRLLRIYFWGYNNRQRIIHDRRMRRIPALARARSKGGVYAIELDSDWIGLGARIVKTLEILLYCEEHGLEPLIRYSYREKTDPAADYFGELFFYKHGEAPGEANVPRATNVGGAAARPTPRFTAIRDIDELGWPLDYNTRLRLATAKTLFDKYLGFQPEVLGEVNQFAGEKFKDLGVLAVHYRGTDKAGEAPLVAKENLLAHIKEVLRTRPGLEIVFISTDDEKIISFLEQSDLPVPVIYREDAVRSKDGDQFHRKRHISKSVVNRDAIVNMLLLSRCDYLLKTASILSDCSVIFNPALEFKLISKPHSDSLVWWPCRELINIQDLPIADEKPNTQSQWPTGP